MTENIFDTLLLWLLIACLPVFLIMIGGLFLLLAIVGRLGTLFEIPQGRHKWAGVFGLGFASCGIGLFILSIFLTEYPLTSTVLPKPTLVSCTQDFSEGKHVVKLNIPAEIAGMANEGQASFNSKQFSDVKSGDRLTIHIEFPDQLVVKNSPQFVSLSIEGQNLAISSSAIGLEPIVKSEGSLELVWNNGGIRSSDAAAGTIDGFWINLGNANSPQNGQTLRCLTVSFIVPNEILSNSIIENQDIIVSRVRWMNIGSSFQ